MFYFDISDFFAQLHAHWRNNLAFATFFEKLFFLFKFRERPSNWNILRLLVGRKCALFNYLTKVKTIAAFDLLSKIPCAYFKYIILRVKIC